MWGGREGDRQLSSFLDAKMIRVKGQHTSVRALISHTLLRIEIAHPMKGAENRGEERRGDHPIHWRKGLLIRV